MESRTGYEKGQAKTFLAKYIDSLKLEHSLSENPMIIFDAVPIGYKNMTDGWFSIKEEEVHEIQYIKKGETQLYGSKDEFGVVLLTTRASQLKKLDRPSIYPIKRIYVLDGKVVSEEFIENFDRKRIYGVTIFRDQHKIAKYSDQYFDELVMISTKKGLN